MSEQVLQGRTHFSLFSCIIIVLARPKFSYLGCSMSMHVCSLTSIYKYTTCQYIFSLAGPMLVKGFCVVWVLTWFTRCTGCMVCPFSPRGIACVPHVPDDHPPKECGTSCLALLSLTAEQTWPSTHETLLTTWKIVAFTATSVLLVLLLVILARMFQTKFKAHFPTRSVQQKAHR